MPLYEYQCDACGRRFELIRKFSDPPLDACPTCGGPVRKLVSSPAFQFKGSGFYITDYPKKDQPGAGKNDQPDKADKTERADKADKPDKSDKAEGSKTDSSKSEAGKSDGAKRGGDAGEKKTDKTDKTDKSDKTTKSASSSDSTKPSSAKD
jgi:putative FmdB family regulatory protein